MDLKKTRTAALCCIFFVACSLTALPGWAQGYGAQSQAGQTDVSADEIASYARAQNQIASIQKRYEEKYTSTQDPQEQQRIIEEMNSKYVDAVQEAGLTVERYNEISKAAQSNTTLQQRISEVMQTLQ